MTLQYIDPVGDEKPLGQLVQELSPIFEKVFAEHDMHLACPAEDE